MLKMAYDIHGTIEAFPDVFKPIMQAYVAAGMKVCIISGPPQAQIEQELFDMGYFEGVHFNDGVYSVVDFIKNETDIQMEQHSNGNWYCDEKTWWDAKGLMCEVYDIDMITDNDIRYKKNMPAKTAFIFWDIAEKKEKSLKSA